MGGLLPLHAALLELREAAALVPLWAVLARGLVARSDLALVHLYAVVRFW